MEKKKENISNNKNINLANIDKEKNFTKKVVIPNIKNIKFNQRYFGIINPLIIFLFCKL